MEAGSDLAALARRARQLGSTGAVTVHLAQVEILNSAFRASSSELEEAGKLVAAYEEATASGHGVTTFHGKMVDVAVVLRARALLKRHVAAP